MTGQLTTLNFYNKLITAERTEHRYTLYLFTTGTLNTFKKGELGDIVLILYTPETRHHKVLLVEISPRTAQQVQ